MAKITAKPNQSLLDVIVMEYGTLEAGMQAAWEEDLSISLLPDAGVELNMPVLASAANDITTDNAALNYLKQNGIVIGTKGFPEPLIATVVLKPKMEVVPNVFGAPHIIGFYSYDFKSTSDFINAYDLLDSYMTPNEVYYETEELYVSGVPEETATPSYATPMSAKSIPYYLPWTVGWGYMMVWTPPLLPESTVTFKDIEGNTATVAPLIILDNVSQDVVVYLIADIEIETIASSVSEVTLKLTRTHPASYVSDFNDPHMNWFGKALEAIPDPADPLNDDVRILTVPPGNYTLGVETSYHHYLGYIFPSSVFSMVISIA